MKDVLAYTDSYDDFDDNQIRVIGSSSNPQKPKPRWGWKLLLWIVILGCVGYFCFSLFHDPQPKQTAKRIVQEETVRQMDQTNVHQDWLGREVENSLPGFMELRDTSINDIPLKLYIPHHAELSLQIGETDIQDSAIIFSAQAADVRADNGGIVGAFVLKGEPLSWGGSKKGFCAVIDGKITIGMAENSPLFEEATEKEGYYFRQYPLVSDGALVENEPKGKAVRRAICDRKGEILMIESETRESFHDFAQALVDLGIDQAISLVGSSAYGWAMDQTGHYHEFGLKSQRSLYRKGNYQMTHIVWRR